MIMSRARLPQPLRIGVAADEEGRDRHVECLTEARDGFDAGLAVPKMIIRDDEIGVLLALGKLDKRSFAGPGGKDGVSPFAKQSARALPHNWSIIDDKNDLAFDRKARGMS